MELADKADEYDWRAHETRAGHLAAQAPVYDGFGGTGWPGGHKARQQWLAAALAEPAEVASSLLLLLIRKAETEGGWDSHTERNALELLKRQDLAWSAADVTAALRTALAMPDYFACNDAIVTATAMAARCADRADPGVLLAARHLVRDVVDRRNLPAGGASRARKHLDKVLGSAVIVTGDGWSAAVLSQLADWPGPAHPVNLLLGQLGRASSGSKPAKSWQTATAELLADVDACQVLRMLVECAATAKPAEVTLWGAHNVNVVVAAGNSDLVRAACWAATALDGTDWLVPALTAIVRRAYYMASAKVPNAAIYGLGQITGLEAISALLQLQRTVKDNGYRKQIAAALTTAAQRAGLSPGQLAERVVPSAGLSHSGDRLITSGSATARVSITLEWKVQAEWQEATGWARKAPAEADAEAAAAAAVKRATAEARAALANERTRLEALLAEDRTWDCCEWRKYYLDQPVTSSLVRAVIWEFDDGNGSRLTGIPAGGEMLDTPSGQVPLPTAATVRLWHPARAATAEVQQWRDHLLATGRRQPFKQAYREVYLITPAELATRVYSNRFAAHILHYRQAYALFKVRGWVSNFLGGWDGGYDGYARRDFPDAGLTAVFAHSHQGDGYDAQLCSTDRVSFCHTGDRWGQDPIPLDEVPDLVFTEAMRDVDLFVSVTSIALDPNWGDRGDDPYRAYWHQYSFGELSQTAAVRRDALAAIFPKLKIASQLELTDRHVRVKGKLNTYKIHIGSGNIQIEPDDRYLCIVAGGRSPKVMLPFEGDQVLTLILSKAVLLVADDKITDPAIIHQLRNR